MQPSQATNEQVIIEVRQNDPDWRRYTEMCAADLAQENQWAKRNCASEFQRLQQSKRIADTKRREIEEVICTIQMGRYSAILNNVQRELNFRANRHTLPHAVNLKQTIDQLKQRVSIGKVYGHLGGQSAVRAARKEEDVNCLLHGSHGRTGRLYHSEQRYWCYSCNKGGDIFDLVMQVRGVTLAQAAQELARI